MRDISSVLALLSNLIWMQMTKYQLYVKLSCNKSLYDNILTISTKRDQNCKNLLLGSLPICYHLEKKQMKTPHINCQLKTPQSQIFLLARRGRRDPKSF